MKRGVIVLVLVVVGSIALAGCGDFQRRAAEAETRIVNAEEKAQLAADAAAANTGRVLDLERRVADLEATLEALQEPSVEDRESP